MDMHGEACWLDLPYRTLDNFATLLESEKLLYEGKCTKFEYESDKMERPIRTSPAAIRLALSPSAWLPPKIKRNEEHVLPRLDVIQADER